MKSFFGDQLFGVCHRIALKIGVATSSVRLYFIYLSFLTLGSPIILYLILAFWLDIKKHVRKKRSVWDI